MESLNDGLKNHYSNKYEKVLVAYLYKGASESTRIECTICTRQHTKYTRISRT